MSVRGNIFSLFKKISSEEILIQLRGFKAGRLSRGEYLFRGSSISSGW
jgi:hypothetical protein